MSSTIKFRCLDDSGNNIFLIDSDSGVYSSSTKDSTNSSSGSVLLYGGLSINATRNATSITSGGGLTIAGGASINKDVYIGGNLYSKNFISTGTLYSQNMTIGNINFTGNLYQNGILFEGGSGTTGSSVSGGSGIFNTLTTQSLNLGVSNYFSGSFSTNNNVETPTNVTGFSFNPSIRSFSSVITISILRSSGGNLFQYINLDGHQTDNGWSLYTTRTGDDTGITFTITSGGQIQYTSSNQANFVSGTLRFTVNQISDTGTYSVLSETVGSYLIDYLQINSTENSNIGTSNGGLYVLGGATITKTLSVNNLRIGTTNVFTGSTLLNNNTNIPTDVTDLSFDKTNIRSFTISGNITIIKSSGSNLYQTLNIIGHQNSDSWELYVDTIGDATGIVFTITSGGQIQYTSTNQTNFVSNTFRFYVNEISNTGSYTKLANTSGTYVIDSIQVNNTTEAVSGLSNGGMNILGGATINKNLLANRISSGNIICTNITSSNILLFNQSNTGTPTTTTYGGDGSRIILSNGTDSLTTPHAIGIETNNVWYSSKDLCGHKWYINDTASMHLTNGNLITIGDMINFGSVSDIRLKTNIENIDKSNALNTIREIRPVTFTWKDDIFNKDKRGKGDLGFIAQEIEKLIPEAVSDFVEPTTNNTYKNIKYERIIPYIIASIQRLEEMLNTINQKLSN